MSSTLNISGNTTLNNVTTCWSSLNVSGVTILNSNVGKGTNNNNNSKLMINNIVSDRWTYDHSTSPLTTTNQTGTGTINDPQLILNLCHQGASGVSYGARATFKLCRYENSGVNSRTRMDIVLSNN